MKTDSPDWQTALIIGAAFLWRCLEKRDARRAVPQPALTRRWEVADKAATKQRKKFLQMENKKWWAWPWLHQCPKEPTSKITTTLRPDRTPEVEIITYTPGPQAAPRLPIYVEWADSAQG